MTYREALATAIDAIRGSATECPVQLAAAKCLERKLTRLRAKETPRIDSQNYCECGLRKRRENHFCDPCYAAFPVAMVQQYHLGSIRQSARAWRNMKAISASRIGVEQLRTAA